MTPQASTQPSPDALAERLRTLEREHRALKGLLLILLVVAAVMGAGSEPPKAIEAQEIILKDAEGHVRARLGFSEMASAVPPAPASAPTAPRDPLDLLDRQRGQKEEVKTIKTVSTACLTFFASNGASASNQCTSWEDPAQTSLQIRVGLRDGALLAVDGDGAVFRLGSARSRRNPEDLGRLAMGAHREGAWLKIAGPPEKETLLDVDALSISEGGKVPLVFPAGAKRKALE